jgi:hypothetical protein
MANSIAVPTLYKTPALANPDMGMDQRLRCADDIRHQVPMFQ